MTIGITAPLALMGAAVIKVGTDYEKAMNIFQSVTRATGNEMARAGQLAQQLGADMTLPATSAGDAAKAMTELAKGGLSAAQAMDAAKGTLQLAAAAGIDEARAAEIAANALNAFGLSASEAGRVSDLLAAAANASSAEINDVALSMQQASAVFASAHVPIEDLTTAIALMANAGIKGSDAGTSLKTMMLALEAPTKKAAEEMKRLGINIFDSHGQFIPFRDMIGKVENALKGMTDQQQAATLKTIFGTDAIRAANIVMVKGVEEFDKMSAAVTRTGAAQELAGARAKGLSGAIDGLVSQLETLGLKIYQTVAPGLETIVRDIAKLFEGLSTIPPQIIKVGLAFLSVFAVAGPVAVAIGGIITLLGGPLAIAIVGVTAGLAILFSESVAGAKDGTIQMMSFKDAVTQVAQVFGIALDAIGTVSNALMILVKIVAVLMTPLAVLAQMLTGDFKGAWITYTNAAKNGIISIGTSFDNMTADMNGRWSSTLNAMVQNGFNSVGGFGAAGTAAGNAFFGNMAKAAQRFPIKGFGGTTETFKWGKPIAGMSSEEIGAIEAGIGAAAKAAERKAKEIPAGIARGIKSGGGAIKAALDDGLSIVQDWLRSTGSQLDISKKAWDSLGKTIQENFKGQARVYQEDQVSVQRWGLVLLSILGKVGQEVVKLANGHLLIRDSSIQLASNVDDVAVSMEKMLIPMSHVDALAHKMGVTILDTGEAAAKAFEGLSDQFQELSNSLPAAWNKIINGIMSGTGKAGSALLSFGIKIKGYAGDILNVFDTMPGKWGQALKRGVDEVNKWVNFLDSAIKLVQRIMGDTQTGLGGLLEAITGIFKHTAQATKSGVDLVTAGLEDIFGPMVKKVGVKATEAGTAIGKGVSSGIGDFLSSAAGITAAIGGALALSISTFQSDSKYKRFLGSFALGGPIGGILAVIFGGPSELQKAQMAAQIQAARDAIKISAETVLQAVQTTIQATVESFNKALDFFDKLDEFTAPRKEKFRTFFRSFSKMMDYFFELAKQWSTESMTKAKAAAEFIGPVAQAISSLPAAFDAINGHFGVAQSAIERFFASFDQVMLAFFARADAWIDGQSKRAMKVANRLNPVVELISGFAGSITAISDIKEPTDDMFAIFDRVIEKIVTHVEALSGKFDKSVLKVMANFAEKAGAALSLWTTAIQAIKETVDIKAVTDADAENVTAGIELFIGKLGASLERMASTDLTRIVAFAQTILPIANALKAWADTSTAVRGYTSIAAESWDAIVVDFGKAITLMGILIGQATQFESMAIALETKLKSGAQHLADGIAAMAGAVVGTASTLQSAFGHINSGVVGTSSMGAMSASSHTTTVQIGGITVNADDPKGRALLQALADLLGVNSGLDSTLSQFV